MVQNLSLGNAAAMGANRPIGKEKCFSTEIFVNKRPAAVFRRLRRLMLLHSPILCYNSLGCGHRHFVQLRITIFGIIIKKKPILSVNEAESMGFLAFFGIHKD